MNGGSPGRLWRWGARRARPHLVPCSWPSVRVELDAGPVELVERVAPLGRGERRPRSASSSRHALIERRTLGRPRGPRSGTGPNAARGTISRDECSQPGRAEPVPSPGTRSTQGRTWPEREQRASQRSVRSPRIARFGPARLLPSRGGRRRRPRSCAAPFTLKVLLENVLRHAGGGIVARGRRARPPAWRPGQPAEAEIPFMPARVILQDFTGVPAVVDLAVMRDAMAALGGDPRRVNPLVPADLVIDHSVQVDRYGTAGRLPSMWSASTSATASATSCCAGPRPHSTTCGWCRRHGHRPPGEPRYLAPVITDPRGRRSPSPTRLSGPTRTPR